MTYIPPSTPNVDHYSAPMSIQEQALYADFVTIIAAVIILVIALWYINRQNDKKKTCICSHKSQRHVFKYGKCWDCKCQEYIDDYRIY